MPAPKVCATPGCPHVQPCPNPDHAPKPWASSDRGQHTLSGSKQQARAKRILRRYRRICHVCGKGGADQVDHVIPLGEGGEDTNANLRPIHSRPCHRDKTQAEAQRARRLSA